MHIPSFPSAITGRVYGVILNDRGSLTRTGAALSEAPYEAAPQAPALYIKPANTLSGNGAAIVLPANATHVEIGATVGIVIGAAAARLRIEDASSVIAGYLVVADLSLPHSSYYRPAIREKCFDGSCVLADRIAPADTVLAPQDLEIWTTINEQQVYSWSLQELVRGVPELLRDVTEFMTLNTGDVLLVGVKWQAPVANVGDRVTISVAGVGEVAFSIASDAGRNPA